MLTDFLSEKAKMKVPELAFHFTQIGEFDLLDKKYRSYKVVVNNNSSSVQNQLTIRVWNKLGAELIDVQLRLNSDSPEVVKLVPIEKDGYYLLTLERFLPSDEAEIVFVFAGFQSRRVDFSVKSAEFVGTQFSQDIEQPSAIIFLNSLKGKIVFTGGYILLVSALGLFLFRLIGRRKRRDSAGYTRSNYNTAFALLHRGLAADAIDVLERILRADGIDGIMASTVGLGYAVSGNQEKAKVYFEIARWFSKTKRANAITDFNNACAHAIIEEVDEAKKLLLEAIKQHTDIRNFAAQSIYISELIESDKELKSILYPT